LGNLDAKRDWGHAKDYVEAMYLILQQPVAEDFVVATGKTYTVKTFCEKTFALLDIQLEWEGEGVNEKARNKKTGDILIEVDPRYFRPTEVDLLIGDPAKAKTKLGWTAKHDLDMLVADMVQSDLKALGL
jgi:GDPmannose 4,6-dehydratase